MINDKTNGKQNKSLWPVRERNILSLSTADEGNTNQPDCETDTPAQCFRDVPNSSLGDVSPLVMWRCGALDVVVSSCILLTLGITDENREKRSRNDLTQSF